jgi:hypothetical protein
MSFIFFLQEKPNKNQAPKSLRNFRSGPVKKSPVKPNDSFVVFYIITIRENCELSKNNFSSSGYFAKSHLAIMGKVSGSGEPRLMPKQLA